MIDPAIVGFDEVLTLMITCLGDGYNIMSWRALKLDDGNEKRGQIIRSIASLSASEVKSSRESPVL